MGLGGFQSICCLRPLCQLPAEHVPNTSRGTERRRGPNGQGGRLCMFSGEEGHSSGAGVKSGMLKQSLQVEDVAGEEATGAVEVNKIISG